MNELIESIEGSLRKWIKFDYSTPYLYIFLILLSLYLPFSNRHFGNILQQKKKTVNSTKGRSLRYKVKNHWGIIIQFFYRQMMLKLNFKYCFQICFT